MKRVTRTYEQSKVHTDFINGRTHIRTFEPCDQEKTDFNVEGLVSSIKLGKRDLNQLGMPKKIRVTVTTVY